MKVFMQRMNEGCSRLSKEEAAVYQYCLINRIEMIRVDIDDTPSISKGDLAVGNVPFIHRCLQSIGVQHEPIEDYPECLNAFLHRKVTELSVSQVIEEIRSTNCAVFAKPKQLKLFTGKIFSPNNVSELLPLPQDTPLFVSSIVQWLCEYRIYVINSQVVAVCRYDDSSDEHLSIDMATVNAAINKLKKSNFHPVAYSLDFGLLHTGHTALIEINDAYALGKYKGISESDYFSLLNLRWQQMTANVLSF